MMKSEGTQIVMIFYDYDDTRLPAYIQFIIQNLRSFPIRTKS
jgi:hypothetical protein